jgi:hypothetical protein
MMTLLAQAEPAAQTTYQGWIILVALVTLGSGLATIILAIYTIASNKKLKREVSFEFEPASKAAFDRLEAEFRSQVIHQAKSDTEQRSKIYARIEAVESGLRSELQEQTRTIEGRIDGVPERIITILKNTGAI